VVSIWWFFATKLLRELVSRERSFIVDVVSLDLLAQLTHQGPGFNYNKEHISSKFRHAMGYDSGIVSVLLLDSTLKLLSTFLEL
jgi:hypothetical protein